MKFGLLYEMETPRPWNALSEYNTYWEALAQIELADRIGIDYVWEVEHHFLEEYSHSSAPEVFYGAVSQRTKNIRIAHGVRLLPFNFNNPIKVAEQAAVLDIMSNGRMELGTGRSTTAQELDGFGVDYDRTRAEVREALDIIVKAWTDEILEYDGKLIKVPPRRVVPKPIQKPHPPIVVGGTSELALKRTVRYGDGWYGIARSMDEARNLIVRLRELERASSRNRPVEITLSLRTGHPLTAGEVKELADLGVERTLAGLPLRALDGDEVTRFRDEVMAKV